MRLLVITATEPEREAALQQLGAVRPVRLPPYGETRVARMDSGTVVVIPAGWGPAASAAAAAVGLDRLRPDAVLSAGLARGLVPEAAPGAVVLADRIAPVGLGPGAAADLPVSAPYDVAVHLLARVRDLLAGEGNDPTVGTVLTAGSPAEAHAVARGEPAPGQAHPDERAVAVGTGGYGVAVAALAHRVPCLELRVVESDPADLAAGGTALDVLHVLAGVAGAVLTRDWAGSGRA